MRGQARLPTIDVLCAPCLRDGRRRRLARFDLGPDGPHIHAWRLDGQPVVPRWTGPDGADKVHLHCGCGHEVQIRREKITAVLQVTKGTKRISL